MMVQTPAGVPAGRLVRDAIALIGDDEAVNENARSRIWTVLVTMPADLSQQDRALAMEALFGADRPGAGVGELEELRVENRALRARLEIDHAYNGKGEAIPFADGDPDGIECRNDTIRNLEGILAEANGKNQRLMARLVTLVGRMYPIMGGPDIPWCVIAPWEEQAQDNHGQTLAGLAKRGGLAPSEAYAIMTGKRWREVEPMKIGNQELAALVQERLAVLHLTADELAEDKI